VLQEAIERALRRYDEFYERNARINTQQQHAMQLTRREREVFSRVVRGKLNKQIAHATWSVLAYDQGPSSQYHEQVSDKIGCGACVYCRTLGRAGGESSDSRP
jgi:regulatory LuxR family protein